MSDAFIEVQQLFKTFGNGTKRVDVLKGIDLVIRPRETLAIVGASGVGKTTLLHILGTLDRPTSGKVLYEGKDVFTLDERALALFRNRQVGFVFQFHHLLPEFNALENTMMPCLIQGISKKEAAFPGGGHPHPGGAEGTPLPQTRGNVGRRTTAGRCGQGHGPGTQGPAGG